MPKILHKYAVEYIFSQLAEIEQRLGRVDNIECRLALVDVRSIRDQILRVIVEDIEVEAPAKIEVAP